jgi:hypothetical protein
MSKLYNKYYYLLLIIILLIFILSGLLFFISFLPYNICKDIINHHSPKGFSEYFNSVFYNSVMMRLRFGSIIALIFSFVLYFYRIYLINKIKKILVYEYNYLIDFFKIICNELCKENITHILCIIIILFFGLYVRLKYLNQPMQCDESATFLFFASRPLYITLANYIEPNNHIFHTLLVKLSLIIFGNQPWAIRMPAFLAGLILIPATYLTCRQIYGKEAAIFCISIVASSSPLIEYSINARGYSIICLLAILAFAVTIDILKNDRIEGWGLLAIFWAIGFYTIPIMLYPFAINISWILLCVYFSKPWLIYIYLRMIFITIIVMVIIVIILYFPVLVTFSIFAITSNKYVSAIPLNIFFQKILPSLYMTWNEWTKDCSVIINYLLLFGFMTSICINDKINQYKIHIIFPIIIAIPTILLIQRVIPFERVWLFLLPFYYIAASSGIVYIFKFMTNFSKNVIIKYIFLVLTIIICIINVFQVINNNERYFSEEKKALKNPDKITIFLKERLMEGDSVIVANATKTPLEYYFYINKMPLKYFYNSKQSEKNRKYIIIGEKEQIHYKKLYNVTEERKIYDDRKDMIYIE